MSNVFFRNKIKPFLKTHGVSLLVLLSVGLFVFLVDGILTLNFSWEDFLFEPLKSASADIVLIATFAKKYLRSSLFTSDYFLSEFFEFYPKPFLIFITLFIKLFGSLEKALIVLSIITNIIFWNSLYSLFYYVTKNRFWSVVIALSSLFYTRPAYQSMWWGVFKPSEIIPRNFILSFAPLLVLYFFKNFNDKKIIYLFIILGLLTNVHSLSSLHLTAWFVISFLLMGITKVRIRTVIKGVLLWIFFSSPYIYSYLTSQFDSSGVPKHIIEYRLSGYFLPTLDVVIKTGMAFVVPLIFGILGYFALSKLKEKQTKKLVGSLISGLVILVLGGLSLQKLNLFVEFQFLRITVYLYILLYLLTLIFFIFITSSRNIKYRFLGYIFSFTLLPFLIFPKFEAFARFSIEVPKVLISKVLPKKGIKEDISLTQVERDRGNIEIKLKESDLTFTREEVSKSAVIPLDTSLLLEGEEEIFSKISSRLNVEESIKFKSGWEEPYHVNFAGNWVEFGELVDFVKENTNPDDIFMLPPDGASIFRLFTERALVVSLKDGSASGFSKEYAQRWFNTYQDVRRAYHSLDADTVVEVAHEYGADYILIYSNVELPLKLVFNNFNYWLYKVE